MTMSKEEILNIVNNEKEWRIHMMNEIANIKTDNAKFQKDMLVTVTTLKVKYGFIGGIFGTIGGAMISFFLSFINK